MTKRIQRSDLEGVSDSDFAFVVEVHAKDLRDYRRHRAEIAAGLRPYPMPWTLPVVRSAINPDTLQPDYVIVDSRRGFAMKMFTRMVLGCALALIPTIAIGQSSPGLRQGQVPTAGQWNSYFAAKQDFLGFTPLNPSSLVGTSPISVTAGAGVVTVSLTGTTGSGNVVLANTPTLITPILGAASATSLALGTPLSVSSGGTGGNSVAAFKTLTGQQIVVTDPAYGAKCDGSTDDTTAINNALATGLTVILPPATCKITGVLNINVSGTSLIGQGIQASFLTSSSTTAVMISVGSSVNHVTISNMTLTRSVTAVATAEGIVFAGNTEVSLLSNLWIENQYDGIALSTTNYSRAENIVLNANQADGLRLINTASSGTCQWILDNILSQKNVLRGFLIATIAGPSQMTLGGWTRLSTFANTSSGLLASAVAGVPINGIRLSNSFFGQDGDDEISLDTRGGLHVISNTFEELAGTRTTGPTFATAASNVGSGINLSANNTDVEILNNRSDGNSAKGLVSSATNLGVIGGEYTRNGAGGATAGISIATAGTIRIVGVRATGSPQNQGIALAAAAINGVINGNDVSGTGGNILDSSTGTTLRVLNNTGYNPVGVTAAATMGASPTTITSGHAPETHYVKQSATNTATIAKGGQQIHALIGATTYYTIELGPNESYVTTWVTTAPTFTKDVH